MKKAFCLIGIGLITSGAAMAIYFLNKKKSNENPECKEPGKKQSPVEDVHSPENASTQETSIYEDNKSSAIGSMYSRHENAATIMKDSVEAICENVKVSTDINDEIDEVSAELEKMLSED